MVGRVIREPTQQRTPTTVIVVGVLEYQVSAPARKTIARNVRPVRARSSRE